MPVVGNRQGAKTEVIVRYSAKALLFVGVVGSSILLSPHAFAIRAVPWIPGRTVIVQLRAGQTTEVVFPSDVAEFSNPEAELFSIQLTAARLYVKAVRPFASTRLFAIDSTGRSYVIEFQEAAEGQKEDDSVEIVPELAERPFAAVGRGRKNLIRALFKAMKRERPIGGFEISDSRKGEVFYEEPKVVIMRIVRLYDSSVLTGYVLEVENLSSGSIHVNPQQFHMEGFIAGSVTDMVLAPSEPESSVEAFKGQRKKSLAYVVRSKEGAGE